MRKRLVVLAATAALMALPSAAMAGPGYGKQINDGCGGPSYGQLVSAAKASGHVEGAVNGAKYWVESGVGVAHGCSF